MKVIESPSDFRDACKQAGPVVLVPTMGALHEGHRALIRRARQWAGSHGTVAVSIFVNPIQFDRPDDLAAYPKPLEADLSACKAEGADLVFAPEISSMYAPDRSITVSENSLSRHLCGATRPGHFDGVCTVVLKLFLLSHAQAAVFGEKDYQQLAIIRRMVRDLDVDIEIIGHPTIREHDGLAMSSRNVRLLPEHRADAPRVRKALLAAREAHAAGETKPAQLIAQTRELLENGSPLRIDYLELVDAESLQPVSSLERPAVLALAVFYGSVRLIDHIRLAD